MAFSFDSIPHEIYNVNFELYPSLIPSKVNMRNISQHINVSKGVYRFEFDNGKNEIVTFLSKYNKLYHIKRDVGIYDNVNYHFKVADFIRCFIRKYGPADQERIVDAVNMPEFYTVEELVWEDSEIIMKLSTMFYSAMPNRKYIPGLNGKHIVIEYTHKANRNYIYGMDFNLPSMNPCTDVW